jgi:hypothetical protein
LCNSPAKAIHLLSGVSGWGFPGGEKGSVTLIVRLHYQDGKTEDHALKNGEHFADYIRKVDVPGSKFAFDLKGRQIRLRVGMSRADVLAEVGGDWQARPALGRPVRYFEPDIPAQLELDERDVVIKNCHSWAGPGLSTRGKSSVKAAPRPTLLATVT